MKRTRLSLFYLVTYLPIAGLALLMAPDFATKLLLSNRTYDDVFPRLVGAVLLALAVLITRSFDITCSCVKQRPLSCPGGR